MIKTGDLLKLKALVGVQVERVRLLEILNEAGCGWRDDRISSHKKRLAAQRLHDERDLLEVYEAQLESYEDGPEEDDD